MTNENDKPSFGKQALQTEDQRLKRLIRETVIEDLRQKGPISVEIERRILDLPPGTDSPDGIDRRNCFAEAEKTS